MAHPDLKKGRFKFPYKFKEKSYHSLPQKLKDEFVKPRTGNKFVYPKKIFFSIVPEKKDEGAMSVIHFGNGTNKLGHFTVHKLTKRSNGPVHMHAFDGWEIDKKILIKMARKWAKVKGFQLED